MIDFKYYMTEVPPKEPGPEEYLRAANSRRVELLTRLIGNRIPADQLAAYLSDLSEELLAAEDRLFDAAGMVSDHIFLPDLDPKNRDNIDFEAPINKVYELNEDEAIRYISSLGMNFKNRVAASRAIAAIMIAEGENARAAAKEALLEGLAEHLAFGVGEPPAFLRLKVVKYREKLNQQYHYADPQYSALNEEVRSAAWNKMMQRLLDEGVDPRIASRILSVAESQHDTYWEYVPKAPAVAKQFLKDYPDLQVAVDLILGAKDGKLPLEVRPD